MQPTRAQTPANPPAHAPTPPGPLDRCGYCGRRCHVPVTGNMPLVVREAYDRAGWRYMSTCEGGALAEHVLLGASYADVVVARLGAMGDLPGAAALRQKVREQVARTQDTRDCAARAKAQADQTTAHSRDLMQRARDLTERSLDLASGAGGLAAGADETPIHKPPAKAPPPLDQPAH